MRSNNHKQALKHIEEYIKKQFLEIFERQEFNCFSELAIVEIS